MTILFYVTAVVAVVIGLLMLFLKADARKLSQALRFIGPGLLAVLGAGLLLTGRAAAGGMLMSAAFAWHLRGRGREAAKPSSGMRSSVRTAALEMELDHDSGMLEGHILAGSREGQALASLDLDDLIELGKELSSDPESLQLLEAYLDRRFPVWREHRKADGGERKSSAPASGSMSKEEAYEILGLEAGASAADIRKAHRRLMQRVHPDLGGSSFLAARINEAKETLLSSQR
ncbi:DnaJ domain-containing protein [Aminobacter sp. J44]|uniref:DnaJ domain-containing protein n=1 Tax=Aminobacter sp. J44 TaxID=935262 RepID=UPI00119A3204|nr:DnaJ domain-containing protein [Aminobacter sp. J44]TWG59372.1 DnaJ-class molecular chaperone with C-terminal Zn finger domain [Aminobacter sp. J44]